MTISAESDSFAQHLAENSHYIESAVSSPDLGAGNVVKSLSHIMESQRVEIARLREQIRDMGGDPDIKEHSQN